MKRYNITVAGLGDATFEAETAGKAKWAAFKQVLDVGYQMSFSEFLRRVYVLHLGEV